MTIILISCKRTVNNVKQQGDLQLILVSSSHLNKVQGTWIHQHEDGFTLLDIPDTMHVVCYSFNNSPSALNTFKVKYLFDKSLCRLSFSNDSTVSINFTNENRTYSITNAYIIRRDTLLELGDIGIQDTLLRLHAPISRLKGLKDLDNTATLLYLPH